MTDARSADVRLFGPFRFDVADQRLFREGKEIKLRRKPFAILQYLTAHPQRLVTQEELVGVVWGKIAMSESLLRTHVSDVRRAVGEGAVETVVGRGYRFLTLVLDLDSRAILLVGEGKKAESLRPFWRRLRAARTLACGRSMETRLPN